MKLTLFTFVLLILTSCGPKGIMDGYGNVNQPIYIPDSTFHSPVTKVFNPLIGNPKTCFIDILIGDESYLYASQYKVDCTYNSDNTVKEFYITFYNTLPMVGTLRYSLY